MSRPTAIIAEDEPLLRGELKDALAALWPELEIVAEAANGRRGDRALGQRSSPTCCSSTSRCPA